MKLLFLFHGTPEFPAESEKIQPEHVEGCHHCSDHRDDPEGNAMDEYRREDLIFWKESRKWWDSCYGDGSHEKRPSRFLQGIAQSAHFPDILFPSHCMNHTACTKKQQRFEESMSGKCTHPQSKEHISQLTDRWIGQDLFNIVLINGDRSSKQGGGKSCNGYDCEGSRRKDEQNIWTCYHVYSGGYHRGRMNERRNRRGTCHRIRKPCEKRYLCTFPDSACKK